MNELLSIRITNEYDEMMIKEILFDHFDFSRKSLSKIKNAKGIYLNGVHVYVTVRVKEGDLLEIMVPEETSEEILPQKVPVDIIYEDEDIVVINKQPDVVVHPTRNHYLGTIANGLMYYWQEKGLKHRFRPVNRLDKDTSGLFIVAKNQYSHHKLALQLQDRTLQRTYHAIVHGILDNKKGTVNAPIMKDPEHSMRRIVIFDSSEAKEAITNYRVIKECNNYSLVELKLMTGRTHQIRVHMSWLGYPLVGDDLYGGTNHPLINRQALHAIELSFNHPITGESLNFRTPYPNDMVAFLNHCN